MEFLVVAAIASLNLTAVVDLWKPLGVLIVAAFVWTGFCLLVVGRRLLPSEYWFELGIITACRLERPQRVLCWPVLWTRI